MAEVSFGKKEGAAPAPVVEVVKTPTPVEGVTVDSKNTYSVPAAPAQTAVAPRGLVLGDTVPSFDQIILPRLNIVQGVGKLKDSFPQGALVYNQNLVLFTPPDIDHQSGNIRRAGSPPVVMTVLGFRPTRYVERVIGGSRGQICNTEAEVRAAGGTTDWNEHKLKEASGMKLFQLLAEALVAIEKPAGVVDDDSVFVYPVGDKKFALALWGMKGSVYTAAAKRVFQTQRAIGCLRGGYPTMNFNVTTRLEKWPNGNSSWIPICLPFQKSTPEVMAFVADVLGGGITPAPATEGADDAE